jgi:hypothetical protein
MGIYVTLRSDLRDPHIPIWAYAVTIALPASALVAFARVSFHSLLLNRVSFILIATYANIEQLAICQRLEIRSPLSWIRYYHRRSRATRLLQVQAPAVTKLLKRISGHSHSDVDDFGRWLGWMVDNPHDRFRLELTRDLLVSVIVHLAGSHPYLPLTIPDPPPDARLRPPRRREWLRNAGALLESKPAVALLALAGAALGFLTKLFH